MVHSCWEYSCQQPIIRSSNELPLIPRSNINRRCWGEYVHTGKACAKSALMWRFQSFLRDQEPHFCFFCFPQFLVVFFLKTLLLQAVSPTSFYPEVPNIHDLQVLEYLKVETIWKGKVEINSFVWVPIQSDCCLSSKRKFRYTQGHQGSRDTGTQEHRETEKKPMRPETDTGHLTR